MIDLIINGTNIREKYGLIVIKGGFELIPGTPRLKYVKVPGMNGELDITEGLTGNVEYENSEIKIELNQYRWLTSREAIEEFVKTHHGKKVEIKTAGDYTTQCICRFIVDEFNFFERINYVKAHAIMY